MTATDVYNALARKHAGIPFYGQVKSGATWYGSEMHMMDAVAVEPSWAHPCITGYEIKVSRSDFLGDEKWPAYLPLCHRLAFACPRGLIRPAELKPGVGLVYVNDSGACFTRVKSVYRDIELPAGMLYYLVIYRAWKETDAPADRQTAWRARLVADYLAGRVNAQELGHSLAARLPQALADAVHRANYAQRQLDEWIDAAKPHDIHNHYQLGSRMRELAAAATGIPSSQVRYTIDTLKRIEKMAGVDVARLEAELCSNQCSADKSLCGSPTTTPPASGVDTPR